MIGDNIKKLRNRSGMTQKSLAEQLFVTAQAVSRWENNEVEPSLSTIAEMARIFNVRTDEILGVESKIEEEIKTKDQVKDIVYKPVLTLCHMCNNPIYESSNIHREGEKIYCTECVKKRKRSKMQGLYNLAVKRRRKSFIIGGLLAGIFLFISLYSLISTKSYDGIFTAILVSYMIFSYISCMTLKNNFIEDVSLEIFSWAFIKLPGLIFTLDLDGIVWLLTVKLMFWILGILLAIFFGGAALIIGGVLSMFVYPFAIYKNIKHPDKQEEF